MDPALNPFSPGAGRPPVALVGRSREQRAWDVALQRVALGSSVQPLSLYGLRGVGKTVLLTNLAQRAIDREWIVAQVEAGAGKPLRVALGEALHAPLVDLARPKATARLLKALKTALSFKASYDTTGTWSFGLDLDGASGGGADSGVLETDLDKLIKDLSAAANETGAGLAILIDEAQDLDYEELVALCAVAHKASQQNWPVLLCIAGLPSLPRAVAEAKSYAERLFEFFHITALDEEAAREVLTLPAKRHGVSWEPDALTFTVEQTQGYPYFLQQYGKDTWDHAEGGAQLTRADARVGAAAATNALDNGFFRVRWDRATKAEQRYLRAMSADGDAGSASRDVATRLGRKQVSLGPARASLISKGLIYAPDHGRIAFTVPGMADFITRQPAPEA